MAWQLLEDQMRRDAGGEKRAVKYKLDSLPGKLAYSFDVEVA